MLFTLRGKYGPSNILEGFPFGEVVLPPEDALYCVLYLPLHAELPNGHKAYPFVDLCLSIGDKPVYKQENKFDRFFFGFDGRVGVWIGVLDCLS